VANRAIVDFTGYEILPFFHISEKMLTFFNISSAARGYTAQQRLVNISFITEL